MEPKVARPKITRRLLLIVAIGVMICVYLVLGPGLYASGFPPIGASDFVEYWAAAQLLRSGGNPYDAAELLAVERAVGWDKPDVLLMWNPPWTLALVLPVSLLQFASATLVWLFVQSALVLASGVVLWRFFAPGDGRYWIGLGLAALFVPSFSALRMGQISPWFLVGVVGFVWAQRERRDLLAGVSLALLMIKPHITYLFLAGALWWALTQRRWRVLAGFVAALGVSSALVAAVSPSVWPDYLVAASSPPLYWHTPTLGAWLRVWVAPGLPWVHFAPSIVGGAVFVLWLALRRGPWQWGKLGPPLLLASVVTSSFGWSHDHVVLLPAAIAAAAQLRRKSPAGGVAIGAVWAAAQVGLLLVNHSQIGDQYTVWHAWVLTGLYWWGLRPDVYQRDRRPAGEAA